MPIKRRRPALNRQKRATYRRRFLRKLARFTRKQKRQQRGGALSEPAANYKDTVVSFTPKSDKIGDPDMVNTQASLDTFKETQMD